MVLAFFIRFVWQTRCGHRVGRAVAGRVKNNLQPRAISGNGWNTYQYVECEACLPGTSPRVATDFRLVAHCVTRCLTPAVLLRLPATRACPEEQPPLRAQSSVSCAILEPTPCRMGASAWLSCGICKHLRGMQCWALRQCNWLLQLPSLPCGFFFSLRFLALTACHACPLGTLVGPIASTLCSQCEAGGEGNSTSRTQCAVATFSNVSGHVRMSSMFRRWEPQRARTQSCGTMESMLLKNEDQWVPVTGVPTAWTGAVVMAPGKGPRFTALPVRGKGGVCAGMGKATVSSGYFALENNPGDVWVCHGV